MWLANNMSSWMREFESQKEIAKKSLKNYQKFTNNGKTLPNSRKHNTAIRKGKFP